MERLATKSMESFMLRLRLQQRLLLGRINSSMVEHFGTLSKLTLMSESSRHKVGTFLLRCELDAAYFHLYLGESEEWGNDSPQLREMFPTPRHAVEYIMETFPIVKRKDIKRHGDYRTKLVILDLYDQMQQAMESGSPFHSQLNPPAGPPTDSEGNFIPMADWDLHHWPSHIHPPRDPIT